MKISMAALRELIAEEVDRAVRRSAGFCMGSGLGGRARGSIEVPPLPLGDEKDVEEDERYGKEQEKSQFAARVQKLRGEADA